MAGEDRYRLAPVRDMRAREERVKRGDLAAAVGDAHETERHLEVARARTAVSRAALAAAIATRDTLHSAAQLAAVDRFIMRRRHELDDAVSDELRAEAGHAERLGSVDVARARLVRARAERQMIERHFERWREERKKLADRRED